MRKPFAEIILALQALARTLVNNSNARGRLVAIANILEGAIEKQEKEIDVLRKDLGAAKFWQDEGIEARKMLAAAILSAKDDRLVIDRRARMLVQRNHAITSFEDLSTGNTVYRLVTRKAGNGVTILEQTDRRKGERDDMQDKTNRPEGKGEKGTSSAPGQSKSHTATRTNPQTGETETKTFTQTEWRERDKTEGWERPEGESEGEGESQS